MYERAPVGKCQTPVPSLYWPKGEQATGDQMKAKNALTTACVIYISLLTRGSINKFTKEERSRFLKNW